MLEALCIHIFKSNGNRTSKLTDRKFSYEHKWAHLNGHVNVILAHVITQVHARWSLGHSHNTLNVTHRDWHTTSDSRGSTQLRIQRGNLKDKWTDWWNRWTERIGQIRHWKNRRTWRGTAETINRKTIEKDDKKQQYRSPFLCRGRVK